MLLGKYVIRRFCGGSKAAEAGLRLGDKVLAINGVDVLDTSGQLRQAKKWSVGEKARVTVVRDGREAVFEVPLVPNMAVQ
jgi:S1-C subfamily serine protease